MVLPIIVFSNSAELSRESPLRQQTFGSRAGSADMSAVTVQMDDILDGSTCPVVKRSSRGDQIFMRYLRRLPYWRSIYWPSEKDLSACNQCEETHPEELFLTCELVCKSLLRHWQHDRELDIHHLGQLAHEFDADAGGLPVSAATLGELAWLHQAMYWRGHRHPRSLFQKTLHPYSGVARWLQKFTVLEQFHRPRSIQNQLVLTMCAYRRRAELIVRLHKRSALRTGMFPVTPDLLDDEIWEFAGKCQHYSAN
jgi:hypothetical protein